MGVERQNRDCRRYEVTLMNWMAEAHSRKHLFAAGLAFLILMCVVHPVAGADLIQCSNSNVVVEGANREDRDYTCQAAAAALGFLKDNGLNVDWPVKVHFSTNLPIETDSNAAGCYDLDHDLITVISLSECYASGRTRTLFYEPLDRDINNSVIAHEVAHAIALKNFVGKKTSRAALEYIAYVTQLSTLPQPVRDRILRKYTKMIFENTVQINSIFLMVNPAKFAVGSYRHFRQPENGSAFWQYLLTEEIELDGEFLQRF